MGIANAERSLSVMRSLVQFASRPENTDVIQMCVIAGTEPFTRRDAYELQLPFLGSPSSMKFRTASSRETPSSHSTSRPTGRYGSLRACFQRLRRLDLLCGLLDAGHDCRRA